MKSFNQEEALLRAWQRKLCSIETGRNELKQQLLRLLTDETKTTLLRRLDFNERRRELLQTRHNQGWLWKPHFNWFFSFLSYILPAGWVREKSGSRLRQALQYEPDVPEFALLGLQDYYDCRAKTEQDPDLFEDALFDQPAQALASLKNRLDTLCPSSSQEELLEAIEYTKAIKYRLDPCLYQHILEQLYAINPAVTSLAFWLHYKSDYNDFPDDNSYIEQQMLSHTIMNHFVRCNTNIYLHNHNILYLLTLLSLSHPASKNPAILKNSDPFLQLLQDWVAGSKTDFSVYDDVFDELVASIKSQLSSEEKSRRASHKAFFSTTGIAETPLQTLSDLLTLFKPGSHPMLTHMARQSLEQLLSDYYANLDDEWWHNRNTGRETINLILCQFISKAFAAPKTSLPLYQQWETVLNPYTILSCIPETFRQAEFFSVSLIKAIQQNNFTEVAYKLRIQFAHVVHLTPIEFNWIFSRVMKTDPSLAAELEHILTNTRVYDQEALDDLLASNQQRTSPDVLVTHMRENLAAADAAAEIYDSEQETAAVEKILIDVHCCLRQTAPDEAILNCLRLEIMPTLVSRYITEDLCAKWHKTLTRLSIASQPIEEYISPRRSSRNSRFFSALNPASAPCPSVLTASEALSIRN